MVLRIRTSAQDFALKIDTESPTTGRLQKEFGVLTALSVHFDQHEASRVVRPYYLSPSQTFFVSEFIDRPTAADLIHNSRDDDQIARIYRRAGAWLHDLHRFQPAKEYGFRPRWMTDGIRDLTQSVPNHILSESQPMLAALEKAAHYLKGIPETQVFSHGDFHSQNLIVGQGEMIALDFTEAREKLAVYDIVDFLKSDIFRDAHSAEVDRSGILKINKDMFFRRYRHPVHMEILDFCIRGRLLKDWLSLWQLDHDCSAYEEDRRQRLCDRLRLAFLHP
ncbi:aminoglycoside phosphotransferase family protein [Ruegeria lacuscaerulensis]|uniref:aminoglycoside phosphotransferase family protein n=1 Tax=Ruegeria lacuscaerulensis TaxID=55218 RepID=UPI00147C716D|nr:aminoglycoside phosphotransferase family protein [Ruegeria lacuscaerulensis]